MNTITIRGTAFKVWQRTGDHTVLIGPRGGRLVLTREIGDLPDGSFGYTGELICYRRSGEKHKRAHADLTFLLEDGRIVVR